MGDSQSTIDARISGRRIRAGVFDAAQARVVAKKLFPSGSDIVLSGLAGHGLVISDWPGPDLLLVSSGHLLQLSPGMRLHMCHDQGEDRIVGEFDELVARGLVLPLRINVSKVNVRVRGRLSVFLKYLATDEPDWPDAGDWSETM